MLFKEYARLAQFFMTSDFLKRDQSVFHWHGYKTSAWFLRLFDKIQPSDCKVNQASWSAGHLEGSLNMNLTCKMSKKFHIPKQTPSTGGSSRQSHSRCSVHTYLYKYIQPFKQLALQSLQVVCFPKQSCFAHAIHLLWPLGRICHPNDPPALCVLEGIGAMISGAEYSRWWSNYTKIPPYLKELSLTKTDCFGDMISLPYFRPNSGRIDVVRQDLQPCSLAALHGCSMFRFLRPDGSLSGWLGRVLSACYQMRRIRSHLPAARPAARPLTRWIDEVKGTWQYELITPNDLIPAYRPLPIIYGTPERKREGSWRNPTETSDRSWGAEVLEGNRGNAGVAERLANRCQQYSNMASSIGCNCSPFSFFRFFMSTLLIFVGVACQRLSMLVTIVFMNWFIIWGHRPARLDHNQHCEVEIQHAEIHRDETSRPSILQSPATSSRRTGYRNHLHLGRKRGICWFPIFWGKAGRSENLQSENSSLFIEVFNKSARVGAMEQRDLPVRSRIRKQEPASGTIRTFWSALRRRLLWNHCRGIFPTPPLHSLGDVVGSLPRPSLPLMAQSKETRHRLKLVWKDSVVCWMLAEIHQKVYLP